MPKIEDGSNGAFLIDGVPFAKGQYEILTNADQSRVAIRAISSSGDPGVLLIDYLLPTEYTDNTNTPLADTPALLAYLQTFFFDVGGGMTGVLPIPSNLIFPTFLDRDEYFDPTLPVGAPTDNTAELVQNQTLILITGETVDGQPANLIQLWEGTTDPTVYDNTNWDTFDGDLQADWNQADSSQPNFIRNKPTTISTDQATLLANLASLAIQWDFDSTITDDPPDQSWRANNVDRDAATQLFLDKFSKSGNARYDEFIENFRGFILIQSIDTPAEIILYELTGNITPTGGANGWFIVPVVRQRDQGTGFTNGDRCTFMFLPPSALLRSLLDVTDGTLPLRSGSGYVDSSLTENANSIVSTKSIQAPPGSLLIGPGMRLSSGIKTIVLNEAGTGRRTLVHTVPYTTSGSEEPMFPDLQAEITVTLTNVFSTALNHQVTPVVITFPPNTANSIVTGFIIRPASSGTLLIEAFTGANVNGDLVLREEFTIAPGDDFLIRNWVFRWHAKIGLD